MKNTILVVSTISDLAKAEEFVVGLENRNIKAETLTTALIRGADLNIKNLVDDSRFVVIIGSDSVFQDTVTGTVFLYANKRSKVCEVRPSLNSVNSIDINASFANRYPVFSSADKSFWEDFVRFFRRLPEWR